MTVLICDVSMFAFSSISSIPFKQKMWHLGIKAIIRKPIETDSYLQILNIHIADKIFLIISVSNVHPNGIKNSHTFPAHPENLYL